MYMDNDKWIGKSYAIYGECLQSEIDFISHFVKPGDVVIDGGANMGAITIPLAQMVGDEGHVYAFEPQKQISYILRGNVALNDLYNVTVYEAGLGLQGCLLWRPKNRREWYETPDQHMAGVELATEDTPDGDCISSMSIDEMSLNRLDFIKLDIEGAEPKALSGARKTIEHHQPVMFIEAVPPAEEIVDFLKSINYDHHFVSLKFFNPNNWAGVDEDFLKEDNDPNLMLTRDIICYPKDSEWEFTYYKACSTISKFSEAVAGNPCVIL
jgi:FkbM family methyltransferase